MSAHSSVEPGQQCAAQTIQGAFIGAAAGAAFGAVQSAWVAKPLVGQQTLPLLLNTAGNIAATSVYLGAAAAIYQGSKCMAVQLRGQDDTVSNMIAGAATGLVVGAKLRRVGPTVIACGGLAVIAGLIKFGQDYIIPEKQRAQQYIELNQELIKKSSGASTTSEHH